MSGMPNKTTFSFVVLLCLMICSPAWSQTNVGQITGQVADSSGAPIADCAVTATNVQTGLKQTVSTDGSGNYVFPSLPTGTYNLRAENRGFRPAESTGVILDAASRRTVDFKLEVGSVTEAVTVTAAADQVQNTSGEVSRTITGTQVSQIPLNGRNFGQITGSGPGRVFEFGLRLAF